MHSKPRRKTRVARRERQAPQVTVNFPPASQTAPQTWKDSRLVVAALTALGTATFWHSVIFPLYDVTQEAELKAYREEAEKVPGLTMQIKNLKARLWHAENTSAFDSNSAYPNGFRLVEIGDPVDRLTSAYETASVHKDKKGYWTVENQHSIFNSVTYYFDSANDNKSITHILFSVNFASNADENPYLSGWLYNEENAKILTRRLIETYGEPKFDKAKLTMMWTIKGGNNLFQRIDETRFLVMPQKYRPRGWTD